MIRNRSPEILLDLHIAASAAYLLGVRFEDIVSILEGYLPVSTRTEVWLLSEGVRIVNDSVQFRSHFRSLSYSVLPRLGPQAPGGKSSLSLE